MDRPANRGVLQPLRGFRMTAKHGQPQAVVLLACDDSPVSIEPRMCKGDPTADSGCVFALFCEVADSSVSNIKDIDASGTCNPPSVCLTTDDSLEMSCTGTKPDPTLNCLELPVKADANIRSYCCPCQQE
jgi:hypothetical protein